MSSHRSSSHNKVKLSKCYSSEVPGQISEYFFFRAGQPQQHEDEEEEDFQDGTVDSGLSSDGTGEGFTPPPLIRRNMAATIRKGKPRVKCNCGGLGSYREHLTGHDRHDGIMAA